MCVVWDGVHVVYVCGVGWGACSVCVCVVHGMHVVYVCGVGCMKCVCGVGCM